MIYTYKNADYSKVGGKAFALALLSQTVNSIPEWIAVSDDFTLDELKSALNTFEKGTLSVIP